MVDVVVPIYNRNTLAAQAIDSVLQQSFSKFTLYAVDDASTTAFSYAPNDQIKILRLPKNKGVAYARNFGVAHGKSPYIAFLDSDDLWHKDKLKLQIDFLQQNPKFHWIHTNEVWYKNGVLLKQQNKHKKQEGIFLERLFRRCLISPSAVVLRRSFFEKHNGFAETFKVAEDYELWLRLNFKNAIAYIDKPLTIKRAGSWSQLSSQIEIDRFRVLALHRFYRNVKTDPHFNQYFHSWKTEILKKINILLKGAIKYQHQKKEIRYLKWQKVFENKFPLS